MRKNKSVKDNSIGKGRRSQGKEISIDLDPSFSKGPQNSHRYDKQLTDRSLNPISQNILKDIINYSQLSQSQTKIGKGTTLASYEKHQDVMSQFNKIKKTSLGDIGRRESQKLTLDHPSSSQVSMKSSQMINENNSLQMIPNELFGVESLTISNRKRQISSKKNSLTNSVSKSRLEPLEKEKEELTAKLDDLQLIEEAFMNQYSEIIPEWSHLIDIEFHCEKEAKRLGEFEKRREVIRNEIETCNDMLLNSSREFVDSRRKWDEKGSGARCKVLDEAIFTHEDFLRRLTVRDFQQTVLFNMKVAIPDHKNKNSVRCIYQDLFHSKSTKKFTMILKKHASHMDLYDGKLLSDFTKRINDLEGQYSRCEGESSVHNDEPFLQKIEIIVTNIDQLKFTLESIEHQKKRATDELTLWRQQERECIDRIGDLIDEMNTKVRGEYERQTDKAADFRSLLTERYSAKYQQFKRARIESEQISNEVERVQGQIDRLFD